MKRLAYAQWKGSLTEGKGDISTQSGILEKTRYSFRTRFEDGERGTNPEELLAAAHAGCFTMAVGATLSKQEHIPELLDTVATLTLEGLTITAIHLSITGTVKGITAKEFEAVVKDAEKTCIISKALSVPITSDAKLIS